MEFCKRLTDLREERHLTQKELAEMLGLQSSAISKYEKGMTQPNQQTLIKLAELFEVTTDYLLGISSVRNPHTTEQFSPSEVDIILRYRKLKPEHKIRIDERIRTLTDNPHN